MKSEQSNARNNLPRPPEQAGAVLKSYNPTQQHFLTRLYHLQHQRTIMVAAAVEGSHWNMRLVNKAINSTYLDCEDLGVGEEARLIQAQAQTEANRKKG